MALNAFDRKKKKKRIKQNLLNEQKLKWSQENQDSRTQLDQLSFISVEDRTKKWTHLQLKLFIKVFLTVRFAKLTRSMMRERRENSKLGNISLV